MSLSGTGRCFITKSTAILELWSIWPKRETKANSYIIYINLGHGFRLTWSQNLTYIKNKFIDMTYILNRSEK